MSSPSITRFNHSHHVLAVKGYNGELDVLAFEGEEALSQPFKYRIEFTSADHSIEPQSMLMKSASLTLQGQVGQGFGIKVQQPLRVIQGVVTGFERLSTSRDETHYAVTLQPRLALLDRSHQNAIYQDASVPQIVEKVLRERHRMLGQDFEFCLTKTYPRREQVMQYDEDDLHFIRRLLGEVGIWFCFTTDTRLNIDVVEFYDSQQGYKKGTVLASVPPSGQHDDGVESVWGMESYHCVVQKQVSTRDYNYRQANEDMSTQVDITGGDTTTYGDAYHYADNFLTPGNIYDRNPTPESGAFYGRVRHERYLNGQTQLAGKTNCATLSTGQVLMVQGGEEVTEAFAKGCVITAMTSQAQRDKSFEIVFHAIPDSSTYSYRPGALARPVMAGTLPARVTSTTENDTYGHIDKAGRYRVNMLFDRDNWEKGFESVWVRQSRPYAGDTYGLHLPLLAGTEVAIGFEDGNPDRPYIAGVLHDSAHADHVTIRNYKRNILRTPANNKIRLDDNRGQEHIKIATEYGGKSQLNLGHVVNNEKLKRGEGFELRTDSWGAIRGGKGLLLTAQDQPEATEQQLSMDEIKHQLSDALSLAASLSDILHVAQIEGMDIKIQEQFFRQNVTGLQKPAVVIGAPGGIALSTTEHIQLSANDNQILTAGGNTEISTLKRLALVAKTGLVAFVQELGMKLVAAKGKVELQAQSDGMDIIANQALSITSVNDEIIISAKKKITLQSGGSYLTISPTKIENGTGGNFTVKSAQFDYTDPATQQAPLTGFTACENAASEALADGEAIVFLR